MEREQSEGPERQNGESDDSESSAGQDATPDLSSPPEPSPTPPEVNVSDGTVTQNGQVGSDTKDDAASEQQAQTIMDQPPLPPLDPPLADPPTDEQTPILRAPLPTDQPLEDDQGRREPPDHGLESDETRRSSEGEGQEEESPEAP